MHDPADLSAAMAAIQAERAAEGLPPITSGSELQALATAVLDAQPAAEHAAPPAPTL